MKSETCIFRAEIVKETEKAYNLKVRVINHKQIGTFVDYDSASCSNWSFWFPKSQVQKYDDKCFTAAEWLLVSKEKESEKEINYHYLSVHGK